ncbi:hypothetical protein Naga_101340g1, partial [Nannochloropsis gaditana]
PSFLPFFLTPCPLSLGLFHTPSTSLPPSLPPSLRHDLEGARRGASCYSEGNYEGICGGGNAEEERGETYSSIQAIRATDGRRGEIETTTGDGLRRQVDGGGSAGRSGRQLAGIPERTGGQKGPCAGIPPSLPPSLHSFFPVSFPFFFPWWPLAPACQRDGHVHVACCVFASFYTLLARKVLSSMLTFFPGGS